MRQAMEFKGSQGFVAPQTVAILGTYDENGVPNAMNAAWCMQSDTAELSISLGTHKTTDNFQKTGAFTVAFATVKTLVISDYFGVESGRNVNKIEKAGAHVHKSAYVNAPVIEEYPLTLECRVKSFEDGILVGEIVHVSADESILTDGKVDLGKMELICFDEYAGVYRRVGEVVGRAFHDGLALRK